MIEKFNFYDVYGYLIPGAVLLVIVSGPFGTKISGALPDLGELSLVVIAALVAYVVGYFLQSMATNAIPSKFGRQYPSVRLLDASDKNFPSEMKRDIAAKCQTLFNLNVQVDRDADDDLGKIRQSAFLLARAATNARRAGAYAEQHQGLYSMMRGLTIVFAIGFMYMIGWALSNTYGQPSLIPVEFIVIFSLAIGLACAIVRTFMGEQLREKPWFDFLGLASVAILFACAGSLLEQLFVFGRVGALVCWGVALSYLIACLRFYCSYRSFSWFFAKAVWTGFRLCEDRNK